MAEANLRKATEFPVKKMWETVKTAESQRTLRIYESWAQLMF
jgi:hypothetical protein